jgi:CHASE3 domain sensor protein
MSFHHIQQETGMSLPLWRYNRRPLLIGATLVFLVSNISAVGLAEFQLNILQDEAVTIEKMHDATKSLLIGLLSAEAGTRGYLVTANEIYLSPYHAGLASIQDQMRALSRLPLDEIQRAKIDELGVMTMRQVDELASLVKLQREQGGYVAGLRLQTGTDKAGLDTLKSLVDRQMNELAEAQIIVQRRSRNYQDIVAYCVMFAAFWLYLIILLVRHPRSEA